MGLCRPRGTTSEVHGTLNRCPSPTGVGSPFGHKPVAVVDRKGFVRRSPCRIPQLACFLADDCQRPTGRWYRCKHKGRGPAGPGVRGSNAPSCPPEHPSGQSCKVFVFLKLRDVGDLAGQATRRVEGFSWANISWACSSAYCNPYCLFPCSAGHFLAGSVPLFSNDISLTSGSSRTTTKRTNVSSPDKAECGLPPRLRQSRAGGSQKSTQVAFPRIGGTV